MPDFEPTDDVRDLVRERYPAYAAVMAGDPSFRCEPDECNSRCCRSLTVPASEEDAARIELGTGRARRTFLECEDGVPLALPLVDPFVLARKNAACALLRPDGSCGIYRSRPSACRSYPFDVAPLAETRPADRGARATGPSRSAEPVLLRHLDCPGFTGEPLTQQEWAALVEEIS